MLVVRGFLVVVVVVGLVVEVSRGLVLLLGPVTASSLVSTVDMEALLDTTTVSSSSPSVTVLGTVLVTRGSRVVSSSTRGVVVVSGLQHLWDVFLLQLMILQTGDLLVSCLFLGLAEGLGLCVEGRLEVGGRERLRKDRRVAKVFCVTEGRVGFGRGLLGLPTSGLCGALARTEPLCESGDCCEVGWLRTLVEGLAVVGAKVFRLPLGGRGRRQQGCEERLWGQLLNICRNAR